MQRRNFFPKSGGYHFLFPSPPLLPSPLEVAPLIELGGLGECCKLPQWGLGQSLGHPRISVQFQLKRWPLLVLKNWREYPHFSKWGGGTRTNRIP